MATPVEDSELVECDSIIGSLCHYDAAGPPTSTGKTEMTSIFACARTGAKGPRSSWCGQVAHRPFENQRSVGIYNCLVAVVATCVRDPTDIPVHPTVTVMPRVASKLRQLPQVHIVDTSRARNVIMFTLDRSIRISPATKAQSEHTIDW